MMASANCRCFEMDGTYVRWPRNCVAERPNQAMGRPLKRHRCRRIGKKRCHAEGESAWHLNSIAAIGGGSVAAQVGADDFDGELGAAAHLAIVVGLGGV